MCVLSPVASRQTLFSYQLMFLECMSLSPPPPPPPQERRLSLMSQLQPCQQPLARIKLKLLGSTGVGKSTLVEALKCSYLGSFFKRRLHPPGATSVAAKNTKSECKCAGTVDGKVFKGFSLFYYRIIKKKSWKSLDLNRAPVCFFLKVEVENSLNYHSVVPMESCFPCNFLHVLL